MAEAAITRPLPLRGFVRTPHHCVWELTNACNLACVHCESASGEARPRELTTAEALQLCDDLQAIGCKTVNLTGGEPFLRPDWEPICERMVALGLTPIIVSNLTLLTPQHIAAMERIGVKAVATSIDGPESVHNRIRPVRRGAYSPFARTVAALRELKSRGFATYAITHISLWNISTLDEIADLLEELKVELWQVQLGFPEGRLAAIAAEYQIYPRQLEEIHRFIRRVKETRSLRLDTADNIGFYGEDEPIVRGKVGHLNFWQGCMAGYSGLYLTSEGDVQGCPSLAIPVGNIRRRPLKEIWNDESLFWYNAAWDETKLEGKCRGCPYRRLCRGGCKSMALSTTGSLYRNIYCLNQIKHLGGDPDRREADGRVLP